MKCNTALCVEEKCLPDKMGENGVMGACWEWDLRRRAIGRAYHSGGSQPLPDLPPSTP